VVTASDGTIVSGQVRLTDENKIVTFVPDSPLQMAKTYVIRFAGLIDNAGQFVQDDDDERDDVRAEVEWRAVHTPAKR